jgi:hypothetical protein
MAPKRRGYEIEADAQRRRKHRGLVLFVAGALAVTVLGFTCARLDHYYSAQQAHWLRYPGCTTNVQKDRDDSDDSKSKGGTVTA